MAIESKKISVQKSSPNKSNKMIASSSGYLFSLLAIILLSFASLILMFPFQKTTMIESNEDANRVRFMTIESFIQGIEKDTNTALKIASFRSLLFIQDELLLTGTYIDDIEDVFETLVIQGEYDGTISSYMVESTMTSWQERVATIADLLQIRIEFQNYDVVVEQQNTQTLRFYLNTTLHIEDTFTNAKWTIPYIAKADVSLLGFLDPLSIVKTKSVQPVPLVFCEPPVSNCLEATTFISYGSAPDYLTRLKGERTSSVHGYTRIVSVPELANYDLYFTADSILDWQYFDELVVDETCHIRDTSSWVVVDTQFKDAFDLACS